MLPSLHPPLFLRCCGAILAGLLAGRLGAQGRTFDLLIRGGEVLDGTGGPARRADLAIDSGRIAAIGDLADARAKRVIEAGGLCVAPGFIDVHAHADSEAVDHGDARNFALMGVTTLVTGNCGGSALDLGKHLRRVEQSGISVNYGSLIGHGTVRTAVMKLERRKPTEAELKQMSDLVATAMADGAFGISTGLIYVPGTYARTEELIALAKVAGSQGGLYVSHMRNENDKVLDSIAEALRIGAEAGVAVHLSHLKASGKANWGKGEAVVQALRAARAAGRRVTGDQYAYPASSTSLDVLFPSEALEVGRRAFAEKLRDDPEFGTQMRAALQKTREQAGFADFSYCQIADAPHNAALNGLNLKEAAARRLQRDDVEAQAQTAISLFVESEGHRVSMVYHSMGEPDVATIMREPWIAIAADAGIRVDDGSRPHPRGSGNNPRVLARYVREQKVLELPVAVAKMTSVPATIFGLEDRGVLREGAWADVVLFDPERVSDRATYAEPTLAPAGIPFVIVNGTVVVEDGKHTGKRPGAVLRAHRSAPK